MLAKLLRLLPYARPHRGKLVAIILMTLAATATSVAQPWPMKILVDYGLSDVIPPDFLLQGFAAVSIEPTAFRLVLLAGLLSLALFLLNTAFDVLLQWTWMATGQRMVYEMAEALFSRLTRLSLLFHGRRSVGDHLERLSTDTWSIYSLASLLLVTPIQHVLTLVGIGTVAWMLDPWMTLLSFSVAPILAGSVLYFGPKLKMRAKRSREAQSRLTQFVHQTVTAIPLVQAFGTEERNRDQYDELVDDVIDVAQKGVLINKSYDLVNGLANSTGRAIVLFAGGLQIIAGNLTVGSLLVFLAYVKRLQDTTTALLKTYSELKTCEASLERLFDVLDADEIVCEAPDARPLAVSDPVVGARIRFDNVSFAYEADRPVLSEISFEAEPGETVAIVGATGAGKSTVVSLIPRFFDPTSGRILFDGTDLREATLDSIRSKIAIVLQEPFLMPLSIAENIAYGCPNAIRDDIIAAAQAARADEFIAKLPLGYDTVIGERGSTLSGGQKQRISIARALLEDAPVVILDEPTSALDAETEASLLEAIEPLNKDRTTFVIAHRLSTIRNADRILVMDKGRIVESGSHEELLARKEMYHRLHNIQFGESLEEVVT